MPHPWQAAPLLGSGRRDRRFNPATPSRFPPAYLFSRRLPYLMVVSDFGSRMGATMNAQVRPDAVIVAAGRFLTSPDIGFRSLVTGLAPRCVLSP
jgi:hypothetical protein